MPTRIFAARSEGPTFEPSAADLPALLVDEDVVLWVSLDPGPNSHERLLTEVFDIHELLVEDALSVAPTPKVEAHGSYLYLILHGLGPVPGAERVAVDLVDVDFFVGKRFLVTHHRVELPSLQAVQQRALREPELLRRGPAFVAHALVDAMVDAFQPLMDRLDAEVAAIEEAIVSDSRANLLERIFALRHVLQKLHRVGLHQRRILAALAAGRLPFVGREAQPFYRDVEDHFVRVMDLLDTNRELLAASSEGYLSMQSHRLNEVMKTLTVISTVMLPLTFVTGLYGMNFDQMPLIHWEYGFEGAIVAMLVIAGLSFAWMRRRGWI